MSATPDEIGAFADRFIAAIERGDADALTEMFTPDAKAWHNFDNTEKSRDEEVRQAKFFSKRMPAMRYEDIRRIILSDGFVQQHVLRGNAADGTPVAIHAMLRAWCDATSMTRIEEYLDPAQAAALFR